MELAVILNEQALKWHENGRESPWVEAGAFLFQTSPIMPISRLDEVAYPCLSYYLLGHSQA